MPTYPLQLTCLGVIIGTPLLASIFVILRIYTRRKLNLRLSWGKLLLCRLLLLLFYMRHKGLTGCCIDDWLIILPLLLSIALIGPSYRSTYSSSQCHLRLADQIQMSRCGILVSISGKFLQIRLNQTMTSTMLYVWR